MTFFEKIKEMSDKNLIARVLDYFNYGKKNKALPEGRQDNIVRRGGLTLEEIYRIERYKAKRSQRYNQTPIQLHQRRNTVINYSNSRKKIEERRISAPKSKRTKKENIMNILSEKPNYIQKKQNFVQEKPHYIENYDKYQKSIRKLKNEANTMKISVVNPERREEMEKKIQDLNGKVESRYTREFKNMQEAYNKTKRGKKIIDFTKDIQNRSADKNKIDKKDGKVEKIVTKTDERANMQEYLKRGVSVSIEKSSYDKAVDEFERALRRRNRLDRMNRRDDDGRGIG